MDRPAYTPAYSRNFQPLRLVFFLYGALLFAQPAIRNSFRAAFVRMLILRSFVAILVTYQGAMRPLPWLRYCFGIKAA